MMSISIFGMGYIGLPTAVMFAKCGFKVSGIDTNEAVCAVINQGLPHINEPDLAEDLRELVGDGMLSCMNNANSSDVFIISVPTPLTERKLADLSFVKAAAHKIANVLKAGDLVILESTVPPGTTNGVIRPLLESTGFVAGEDFWLAYCPERVLPGNIVNELIHNGRVIGGVCEQSALKAKELFANFVEGDIYITDVVTAEICKLMENTYRDVNIALANELAMICDSLGADVWEILCYANKHPRVQLHNPGPGVGGHCLPIDPWFVANVTPHISTSIIQHAREINALMPKFVFDRIKDLLPTNSRVVILGCTYKPDVSDFRESPILVLKGLLEQNYSVSVVDPYIIEYDVDLLQVAKNADMLILGVNHSIFRNIDLVTLRSVMRNGLLFDTRNFFQRSVVEKAGFTYHLLGNGASTVADGLQNKKTSLLV